MLSEPSIISKQQNKQGFPSYSACFSAACSSPVEVRTVGTSTGIRQYLEEMAVGEQGNHGIWHAGDMSLLH